MITIECKDINDLKADLAWHLSQRVDAIPVMRTTDIVLDPLTEKSEIKPEEIRTYVLGFLESQNEECDVIINGEKITVKALTKRKIRVTRPDSNLLICPHCGKVTPYEEEMNVHIKLHYFV